MATVVGALSACASSGAVGTSSAPVSRTASPTVTVDVSQPPTYRKEFGTMWTFDAPPLDYWKQTYGFTPAAGWLDNVRLASVRLPGCSSSFVSANGLVMTNHHCARGCIASASPKDTNYMETGFTAGSLAEEKKCTNVTLDQLQSIEDITSRVQAAMTGSTDSAKTAQRNAAIQTIQMECAQQSGLACQVVTLYNGGRYSLYRFKRYTDVRLVMAPDEQAGFFGGDPDNFTFPRYALDMTFLRAYENGVPAKTPNFLRWSPSGARENELVFVIGNPGSTERLATVAQLEYNRDIGYPLQLAGYVRNLKLYREEAAKSPELARQHQNTIFGLENSFKAVNGFWGGLKDSTLMSRKRAFEAEVRARVAADPKLRAEYGGAWDAIAAATKERAEVMPKLTYYFGGNTGLFGFARTLIAVVNAPASDSMAGKMRAALANPQQVDAMDREFFVRAFAAQLRDALITLPANDPYLQIALAGQSPEDAAARIIRNTQIQNVEFRRTLIQGGPAAIASSTDPLIAFVRQADALEKPLRARAAKAEAIIATNTAAIGRALYAIYGTILPPDATFTLRISDGIVKGYPMNGTVASYKTTLGGLYSRAADFDNRYPFNLSHPIAAARDRVNMNTPVNFVSTNDIIGGNSGSPVINQNGEVVGLIFDGNIESLPNRFVFTDEVARSVSVHSQFIMEALRNIYNAKHIADELEGKAQPK
jgi:hypothetical protein